MMRLPRLLVLLLVSVAVSGQDSAPPSEQEAALSDLQQALKNGHAALQSATQLHLTMLRHAERILHHCWSLLQPETAYPQLETSARFPALRLRPPGS